MKIEEIETQFIYFQSNLIWTQKIIKIRANSKTVKKETLLGIINKNYHLKFNSRHVELFKGYWYIFGHVFLYLCPKIIIFGNE